MNFIIIIVFIFIGSVAKKAPLFKESHTERLNQYVIFICLPAIIFLKVPQLTIDYNLLLPAIMSWLLIPVLMLLVWLLGRIYQWTNQMVGCLLMIVCFGNTSFVGFPIIQAFYGDEYLVYAVIYDQLGSFLNLAIIGNIIIAKYSLVKKVNKKKLNLSLLPNYITTKPAYNVLKKIMLFPPFVAILISFSLQGIVFNELIITTLSAIAMTLVPATMILIGYHFELKIPSSLMKPLFWGLGCKMIIAPVICAGVIFFYNTEAFFLLSGYFNYANSQSANHIFKISLMETAMPPMVTASIMAIHAKLAPKLAAAAVSYGLVLAVFTMPLVYFISNILYN